jgi:hypothetical protein
MKELQERRYVKVAPVSNELVGLLNVQDVVMDKKLTAIGSSTRHST